MPRSLPAYLLACAILLACEGSKEGPGEPTTGPQTGSDATSSGSTTDDATGPTTTGMVTSGSEATAGAPECPLLEIEVRPTIPQLMLVLDKSGSMVQGAGVWDHDGDDADDDGLADADPNSAATPRITRWQSLHETVVTVVGEFEARMDFGAVLFPALEATVAYDSSACPVHATPDVPIGPDQGPKIVATIPAADATDLHGGTPTTAAIHSGVAGLVAAQVADGPPQYLVLVTDGAANCPLAPIDDAESSLFEVYDEQLPLAVAEARAAGIPTFVVGIAITHEVSGSLADGLPDDTDSFARLNDVAEAGGRARPGPTKFHEASDQAGLHAALQAISQQATSCTLQFDRPLLGPEHLRKLEVGGADPLVYDADDEVADCASESGWRFADADRTGLELCGDACTQYRTFGLLDLEFDCVAG